MKAITSESLAKEPDDEEDIYDAVRQWRKDHPAKEDEGKEQTVYVPICLEKEKPALDEFDAWDGFVLANNNPELGYFREGKMYDAQSNGYYLEEDKIFWLKPIKLPLPALKEDTGKENKFLVGGQWVSVGEDTGKEPGMKWVKEQADQYAFNLPASLDSGNKGSAYSGFIAGANAMKTFFESVSPYKEEVQMQHGEFQKPEGVEYNSKEYFEAIREFKNEKDKAYKEEVVYQINPISKGGLRWVKASERLPGKSGKYWIKYINKNGERRSGSHFNGFRFPHHKSDVEWLDESLICDASAGNGNEPKITDEKYSHLSAQWKSRKFNEDLKEYNQQNSLLALREDTGKEDEARFTIEDIVDAWETGELFGERVERDAMTSQQVREVRAEFKSHSITRKS